MGNAGLAFACYKERERVFIQIKRVELHRHTNYSNIRRIASISWFMATGEIMELGVCLATWMLYFD